MSFFACRYFAARPEFLTDHPNHRSSHANIVSRGGGAALVIASLWSLIVLAIDQTMPQTESLLVGSLFFAMLGLADDRYKLSAKFRLLISFGAVCFFCFWGLYDSITLFHITFSGWPVRILHIFWVLGCIHFFNFMDGIDGLAGLQAWWIAIIIALASGWVGLALAEKSLLYHSWMYLGIASALLGFLYWNWPNGTSSKLFMGDGGSYFLAFLLSFGGVVVSQKGTAVQMEYDNREAIVIDLGIFILAWLPFLVDASLTILWRLASKGNIFQAHRQHLYQILLDRAGWSVLKILFFYFCLNLGCFLVMLLWFLWPTTLGFIFSILTLLLAYTGIFINLRQRYTSH